MMSKDDSMDNVIRVDFSALREEAPDPNTEAIVGLYDPTLFDEDPLAAKKLEIFAEFIAQGMVSVTLDPKATGVSVPKQFRDMPQLVLNFSHRFYIEDFTYDAHAVCASLSFQGVEYYCVVPWAAVQMLLSRHDNRVAVFDANLL
ncbi:MAG: ClpXP protease specificity-enhancing factor SspB [Myxococcota bacterium]